MEKYERNGKSLVMSRDEVRSVDRWAINELGIPGVVLMENAGRSCAELIKKEVDSRSLGDKFRGNDKAAKICIFCGTGNNGGDGYVIARHLLNSNYKVSVVIVGDREKIKGDAKINLDILEKMSPHSCPAAPPRVGRRGGRRGQENVGASQLNLNDGDIAGRVKTFAGDADMLVDGLFGTGLSGQLSDEYKQLIESINAQNRPILAIDIPSGLDCDTGQPLGAAIKASWTVTFVAVKKGFTFPGAAKYTGEIFVASIGVEPVGLV